MPVPPREKVSYAIAARGLMLVGTVLMALVAAGAAFGPTASSTLVVTGLLGVVVSLSAAAVAGMNSPARHGVCAAVAVIGAIGLALYLGGRGPHSTRAVVELAVAVLLFLAAIPAMPRRPVPPGARRTWLG